MHKQHTKWREVGKWREVKRREVKWKWREEPMWFMWSASVLKGSEGKLQWSLREQKYLVQ